MTTHDRVTHAQELAAYAYKYVAWNMPAHISAYIYKTTRNQFGTTFIFNDGSRAFIPKGSSKVETVTINTR